MIYSIDIDGTICETKNSDYPNSMPLYDAIEQVNKLYDDGHTIKIFTGRGSRSGLNWQVFTTQQLKTWGVKYHELHFGKPSCDQIIDDKNISLKEWRFTFDKRIDLLAEIISGMPKNNKILIAGNGGLCAEASHFAAELVGKFAFDVYIPAFSIGDSSPLTTALANDIGFSDVFSHQIKVLGNTNDIFIGMTTSKSQNIVKALEAAKKKEMITVVICSTKITEFDVDYMISIPGEGTAEIQENTLKFLHKVAWKAKENLIGERQ